MELPGGLLLNGSLRRDLSFKPVTGALERIISESGLTSNGLAQQITLILSEALDTVAGLAVDEELVCSLCSADRDYLMQQLEAIIAPAPKWLTVSCRSCHELMQFQFIPGSLPVKAAAEGFPETRIMLSIGELGIRVPNGRDEEIIASQTDNEDTAVDLLLSRLLTSDDQSIDIKHLNTADKELIDQMLDNMSPQPAQAASINCPYCNHYQDITIDSYDWINRETGGLDKEIHSLAIHYHWSEKEILALPRTRRKRYIQLIEQSSGMYQAEDFMHRDKGMNRGVML